MSVYAIIWSPKSRDGLMSLDKGIASRMIKRVEELKFTPYHFIDRITDTNLWKVRVGDYRAILDMDERKKEIHVLKVGHRKNIYRQL
jgi:mRNA interferase RelE/StbE